MSKVLISYSLVLADCIKCKQAKNLKMSLTNDHISLGCLRCKRYVKGANIKDVIESWKKHNTDEAKDNDPA